MISFHDFLNELDQKNGSFPGDSVFKLRVNVSKLSVEYLRAVSKNDGRTLTWHINKAIELYIESLSTDNKTNR